MRQSCDFLSFKKYTNNSLLHTRKIKFDNYYLVPNAIDEGVIKINIMCAEYTDPISFEIPVVVTA